MIQAEPFFSAVWQQRDLILDGLQKTLLLFGAITITGFLFGLGLFYFRIRVNRWASFIANSFTSFFVSTPLIVILFLAYYGLPELGWSMTPFEVALWGFTFNVGSYNAFYLYGAYKGIRSDEIEAAKSQGFRPHQIFWYIVLPQTLRFAAPSLMNQVVRNLKDTSLVFLIQYVEFFARMQELASSSFLFFESYLFTCGVYIALVAALSVLSKWGESKLA